MTTNRVWRRWFWWATAGEVVGFALPAATGVASSDWSAPWPLVAVVAADHDSTAMPPSSGESVAA
jgi:hypothetical protein